MALKKFFRNRQLARGKQLASAFGAIEAHVASLVADAQLLHDHRRYERAAAISVLAVEESAKLAWVFGAETHHLVNKRFDWRPINRAATRHDIKLRFLLELLANLYARGSIDYRRTEFESIKPRTFAKQLKEIKEAGLYIPLSSGTVGPRFPVGREISASSLALAVNSAGLLRVLRSKRDELSASKP